MKIYRNILFRYLTEKFTHGHSLNYFLSGVLIKGGNLIMLPIVLYYLTQEEYGYFSLISSTILVLHTLLTLNFQSSIIRYRNEPNAKLFDFLATNIVLVLILNLLVGTYLFIYLEDDVRIYGFSAQFIRLSFVAASLGLPMEIYLTLLKSNNRSIEYRNMNLRFRLLSISLTISFIVLLQEEKYLGRFYALALSGLFLSGYLFYTNHRQIKYPKLKLEYLKYSMLFGLPLIPHLLSSLIIQFSDRVMVNSQRSTFESSQISLIYDITLIVALVNTAQNTALAPVFMKHLRNTPNRIENLAVKNSKNLTMVAFILVLFSDLISELLQDFNLVISAHFLRVGVLTKLVMSCYTFMSHYSIYNKRTIFISFVTFFAALINIPLNNVVLAHTSHFNVFYSSLIVAIVIVGLHYLIVRFYYKESTGAILNMLTNVGFLSGIVFVLALTPNYIGDWMKLFLASFGIMFFYLQKRRA